jgi:hypothetical protein
MKLTKPKDYIDQYTEESGFKSVQKMIEYYEKENSTNELLFDILTFYKNRILMDIKDNLIEG